MKHHRRPDYEATTAAWHTPLVLPDPLNLAPPSTAPSWLDELDFTPGGPPVLHMGLTALDPAQWLVVDDRRDDELSHKQTVLGVEHDEAVVLADASIVDPELIRRGAQELLDLLVAQLAEVHGIDVTVPTDCHPLEACSRIAQEDFALITPIDGVPWLVAAAVCFPNGWYPRERVGRPLIEVHDMIPRYAEEIASKVDRVFTHLSPERPLWRRNWFVYDQPALYNPGHDEQGRDPEPAELYLRSERETMRTLPESGVMVFTIRTQQVHLDALAQRPDIAAAMAAYFRGSPEVVQRLKGVISYLPHLLDQCDRMSP